MSVNHNVVYVCAVDDSHMWEIWVWKYMDPLLIKVYLSRVLLNIQYLLYMVVERIKERSHGKHYGLCLVNSQCLVL